MCHISNRPDDNRNKTPKVLSPAPKSVTVMIQRRSHRSTTTPANGENNTRGSTANNPTSANWVVEPVCWNTHTPNAKLVRPEPMSDTLWPSQRMTKVVIPPANSLFGEAVAGTGIVIHPINLLECCNALQHFIVERRLGFKGM